MKIYQSKIRFASLPLALLVLIQSLFTTPMVAQSSGPVQPEFQQTSVVGADNLVDPFTGNFNYSIPLMEIGGFPLTLSYSSDHKMEEEASWVGFGWTLNPGAISRQVRGLPDDFRGDEVVHKGNMAPSVTTGISPGADFELFGGFGLGYGMNFSYNNYSGFQFSQDLSPSFNIVKAITGDNDQKTQVETSDPDPNPDPDEDAGTDETTLDDKNDKTASLDKNIQKTKFGAVLGTSINSRSGMEQLSFRGSYTRFYNPSATISFGGFNYTPVGDLTQEYDALAFNYKQGFQVSLPDAAQLSFRVNSVIQRLKRNILEQPAYGYLYLDASKSNKYALQDYNKDQGGLNLQDSPRIPMAYGTPDVYAVSGPGMSGQLKVSRNDVGMFRPTYSEANSSSTSAGLDFSPDIAVAPGAHLGLNVTSVNVKSTKGPWALNNELAPTLDFQGNQGQKENAFFHFTGEASAQMGQEWYEDFVYDTPIVPVVSRGNGGLTLENALEAQPSLDALPQELTVSPFGNAEERSRRPRAQQVTYFTAEEAADVGLEQNIKVYDEITSGNGDFSDLETTTTTNPRNGAFRADHHISEMRITKNNGQRYIYGLPSYNLVKKEVTFNISANETYPQNAPGDADYGLIQYVDGEDNSTGNDNGRDNFYDEVITSPYPAAHLLTSILSSDYIDRLNDGPTTDDLGQYVTFHYSQLSNTGSRNNGIGWRTPLGENLATFNPGNLSDTKDDRASYVFGEKEVFYTHHIDSKTHRAVFVTSPRNDAFSAEETGGLDDDVALRKLDEIRLYTLAELQEYGEDAIPIKSVHFTYDENGLISKNLPGLTNTGTGKLTLTKVHFTYADNERGQDNPYQFDYKTKLNGETIGYEPNMIDRWGNQVPSNTDRPGPQLHPYSIQDEATAENYCDLGNLTEIKLPTGGKIVVEYEPDAYAYVQDKRAGRMYEILGFSREAEDGPTSVLYEPAFPSTLENFYVHVAVDDLPMDGNEVDMAGVRRDYLTDVKRLYFEAIVRLTNSDTDEKITGFADYVSTDLSAKVAGDGHSSARIILRMVGLDTKARPSNAAKSIHPISFAAIEKIKLELHRLQYSLPASEEHISPASLLNVLSLGGGFLQNFYRSNLAKGNARKLSEDPGLKSYLRLADGRYKKFGDGSRVRTVTLSDEWLRATNPDQVNEYVQLYQYETDGPDGTPISSGVAANEPMIGKEEMLMVDVQKTSLPKALAPNENYYTMWPVGLSFFPGPRVGYAKVTMSTLLKASYEQSKPGTTEYQFFTARDFPTLSSFTKVNSFRKNPPLKLLPFVDFQRDRLGLAQGYVVEVNDMHGKMKQQTEFDYYGTPISSSVYRYRQKENTAGSERNELDNLIPVTDKGNFRDDYLGMDMEVWIETTASSTTTSGGGASGNIDLEAPVLPVLVPSLVPTLTNAEVSLNTAVVTKLVSRYGILAEVEVTNNGSSLATKNLRWDALTGAAVMTSTENEFDQPIYNHTLPAYYLDCYDAMGAAYLTEGARYIDVGIANGIPQPQPGFDPSSALFPGDELYISLKFQLLNWEGRAHVMPGVEDGQVLITWDDGTPVNNVVDDPIPFNITVVRSGRCNMLGATAEQTASLKMPNDGDFWSNTNSNLIDSTLLSFAAVEYADAWGNMCLPVPDAPEPPDFEPGSDECENYLELQQLINLNPPIVMTNQTGCTVSGYDWLSRKEELIECDLCMELYLLNASAGLLSNMLAYQYCTGPELDDWAFQDGAEERIRNCEFLSTDENPHLRSNDPQNFEAIYAGGDIDGICYPPYDDCQTDSDEEEEEEEELSLNESKILKDSYKAPVQKSSTPQCFPWSPATPTGNPYLNGRRGNWRVKAQYVANQQGRNKSAIDAVAGSDAFGNNYKQPLLHQDGTLDNFYPFWDRSGRINEEEHQLTSEVTAYDDHGHGLETEDALGIPSGAQYGFFQNLPTAIAQNSKRTDLGYDSFEDAAYVRSSTEEVWTPHFSVIEHAITNEGRLTDDEAHTGLYSLELVSTPSNGEQVRLQYSTNQCPGAGDECAVQDPCSCVNRFAPAAAQKYQLSLWVARRGSLRNGNQAATPDAEVVIESPSVSFHAEISTLDGDAVSPPITVYPSGPVIEGWQRLTASFDIPDNATDFSLVLKAPTIRAGEEKFYVDDLRIHPYESSMVTYAYNPYTLRLMAQMDDNGYAVFYEYDDEGQLIRQKRETERGVMTITEQHTNLAKTDGQ